MRVVNTLWTDTHFSLSGSVNTQKCSMWAIEKPYARVEKLHHDLKVTVWCWFPASFVIDHFFFEKIYWDTFQKVSLIGERCAALLNNKFILYLQEIHALHSYRIARFRISLLLSLQSCDQHLERTVIWVALFCMYGFQDLQILHRVTFSYGITYHKRREIGLHQWPRWRMLCSITLKKCPLKYSSMLCRVLFIVRRL